MSSCSETLPTGETPDTQNAEGVSKELAEELDFGIPDTAVLGGGPAIQTPYIILATPNIEIRVMC
jgi:hypothetical protein